MPLSGSKPTWLTFDCYGTLIDWESGILEAVGGVLARHALRVPEDQIIRLYASFEAEIEAAGGGAAVLPERALGSLAGQVRPSVSEATAAAADLICAGCGRALATDARFCDACGRSVETSADSDSSGAAS